MAPIPNSAEQSVQEVTGVYRYTYKPTPEADLENARRRHHHEPYCPSPVSNIQREKYTYVPTPIAQLEAVSTKYWPLPMKAIQENEEKKGSEKDPETQKRIRKELQAKAQRILSDLKEPAKKRRRK